MAQITLTLEMTPHNVSVLCEVLPRFSLDGGNASIENGSQQLSFFDKDMAADDVTPEPAAPAEKKKPATTKAKTEKTPAAKAEPATEKPAEKEKAPATAAFTKTDVRALALKLSKAGKREELKAILEKYGADKLSGVAEADYSALKEDLEAANAEA